MNESSNEQKTINQNKKRWDKIRKRLGRPVLIRYGFHTKQQALEASKLISHMLKNSDDYGIYFDPTSVDSDLNLSLLLILFRYKRDATQSNKIITTSFKEYSTENPHTGDIAGSYLIGSTSIIQREINRMPLEVRLDFLEGTNYLSFK